MVIKSRNDYNTAAAAAAAVVFHQKYSAKGDLTPRNLRRPREGRAGLKERAVVASRGVLGVKCCIHIQYKTRQFFPGITYKFTLR